MPSATKSPMTTIFLAFLSLGRISTVGTGGTDGCGGGRLDGGGGPFWNGRKGCSRLGPNSISRKPPRLGGGNRPDEPTSEGGTGWARPPSGERARPSASAARATAANLGRR